MICGVLSIDKDKRFVLLPYERSIYEKFCEREGNQYSDFDGFMFAAVLCAKSWLFEWRLSVCKYSCVCVCLNSAWIIIQSLSVIGWYMVNKNITSKSKGVMDKSGAGAGFLRELRFPLPIYIPSALHNHAHYHPRLAQ
jgi:hypothetical protein